MSEEFKEKIRSINFGRAHARKPKVTVERDSKIEATTTEHWHDRQDVNIKMLKSIPVTQEAVKRGMLRSIESKGESKSWRTN